MAIFQTYTVNHGDTLWSIANAHGVSVDFLCAMNNIRGNIINIGQVLKIKPLSEVYYTVKSGDTLYSIAKIYRVTVLALKTANQMSDNIISINDDIIIPCAGSASTASSISPVRELGNLSKKYEVGNNGPGKVSTGNGDIGGVSYGSYQMSTASGNPLKFLENEGERWRDRFSGTVLGTESFSQIWRDIARENPDVFHAAQHEFIKRTHFDPHVENIKELTGVDVTEHSRALQDVVWSTAVQHGPNNHIIAPILDHLMSMDVGDDFDEKAIIAIYGERGRSDANGILVHFSGNSLAVQRGVAQRFRNELNDALAMLRAENAFNLITPLVPNEGGDNEDGQERDEEHDTELLRRAQNAMSDEDAYLLIEKYGDLEARNEFLAGKKILIALRVPTNYKQHLLGRYDDPILLMWREANGRISLRRFMGNTEPAGIYAWGQARQSRGSSVDINDDGRNDLGRLRAGTYHFSPRLEGHYQGNKAFRARDIQVVMRDVNHDGEFSLLDGDKLDDFRAERSMLIHQGGEGSTWSAGCQTLPKSQYIKFLTLMGNQENFSYILINV